MNRRDILKAFGLAPAAITLPSLVTAVPERLQFFAPLPDNPLRHNEGVFHTRVILAPCGCLPEDDTAVSAFDWPLTYRKDPLTGKTGCNFVYRKLELEITCASMLIPRIWVKLPPRASDLRQSPQALAAQLQQEGVWHRLKHPITRNCELKRGDLVTFNFTDHGPPADNP